MRYAFPARHISTFLGHIYCATYISAYISSQNKSWEVQTVYLSASIGEVIKSQCFEKGSEPDGLRNMRDFSTITLSLVALACAAVRPIFLVLSCCYLSIMHTRLRTVSVVMLTRVYTVVESRSMIAITL